MDIREEFEKLDEIKVLICDGEVYFDKTLQEYVCIRQDDGGVEKSLNLALRVFKRKYNGFGNAKTGLNNLLKTVLWHKEDRGWCAKKCYNCTCISMRKLCAIRSRQSKR